jgi:hypothetical protein
MLHMMVKIRIIKAEISLQAPNQCPHKMEILRKKELEKQYCLNLILCYKISQ